MSGKQCASTQLEDVALTARKWWWSPARFGSCFKQLKRPELAVCVDLGLGEAVHCKVKGVGRDSGGLSQ